MAKAKHEVKFIDGIFGAGGAEFAATLREATGSDSPKILLVADSNVVHRTEGLGKDIGRFVQETGIALAANPIVLNGGEKAKCDDLMGMKRIVMAALESRIGPGDAIVALGGGSILDVAGFAAAQVRGGIDIVRLPTTPAAMADMPFAETAAVNAGSVKDALKLPSKAAATVIDFAFSATVLDGVWRGGVGEIIRHAAVADASLMKKISKNAETLKSRDMAAMREALEACVESKLKKGNTSFALWSAVRMEAMSGYKLPHGYAVPLAICIDCAYSAARGLMKESEMETVCATLANCGALDGLAHSRHLLTQPESILHGLDALRLSKGSEAVEIPAGIGKFEVEEAPDRELYAQTIRDFLSASHDM